MPDYRPIFDAPPRHLAELTPPPAPAEDETWVDLYELLEVSPGIGPRDLDEAIAGRGADCLCFAFSRRAGKPGVIRRVEKHLDEFRPILLDPATRRRYDALREAHRRGDETAASYAEFLATVRLPGMGGCLSVLLFALVGCGLMARHWS